LPFLPSCYPNATARAIPNPSVDITPPIVGNVNVPVIPLFVKPVPTLIVFASAKVTWLLPSLVVVI